MKETPLSPTNAWGSNLIGLFKVTHMTTCIPIHILLICNRILQYWLRVSVLQYWLALGIYTPREPHICKNSKNTTCYWILNSLVGNCICGHFSSSWNYRLHTLSRRLIWKCVQRDPSECTLLWQFGHNLHITVSLSWINVLSCIPCVWPAAVEHSYYTSLWHGKLADVSRDIFLSLSLPTRKIVWLGSEVSTS